MPEKAENLWTIMTLVITAIILNLILRIKIYLDKKHSNAICGQQTQSHSEDSSSDTCTYGTVFALSLVFIGVVLTVRSVLDDADNLALMQMLVIIFLGIILPMVKIVVNKAMRKYVRQIVVNIFPFVAKLSAVVQPTKVVV